MFNFGFFIEKQGKYHQNNSYICIMSSKHYILRDGTNYYSRDQEFNTSVNVSAGGFMLCTMGSATAVVNTKQYNMSQHDLIVALPYSQLQIQRKSHDFNCIILGVQLDFIAQLEFPNKGNYFNIVKGYPLLHISCEDAKKIETMVDLLVPSAESPVMLFDEHINNSLLKGIFYTILNIYSNHKLDTPQVDSRDEVIFHNFILHLINDFKHHRSLSHYAQKQHITASYLSRAIKRATGRNGSNWIVEYMINNIKHSLSNNTISIAAIAEEYNFPSSSIFSQYFRKHTDQTPKEYRKSII